MCLIVSLAALVMHVTTVPSGFPEHSHLLRLELPVFLFEKRKRKKKICSAAEGPSPESRLIQETETQWHHVKKLVEILLMNLIVLGDRERWLLPPGGLASRVEEGEGEGKAKK